MRRFIYFVIIVIIIFAGAYFYSEKKMSGSASNSSVEQTFQINEGEGVNLIAGNLQRKGLVSNRIWFEIYIWSKNKEKNIVAGTYTLRANMTIPEITDMITTKGKANKIDRDITIIEGWNLKQIGEYLSSEGIVSNDDFIQEASNLEKYRSQFSFLKDVPKDQTLEGYLFPDTYKVIPGKTTAEQIIFKMLDNFNHKVTDELRGDADRSGHGLHDIITMASIIEKEVTNDKDKKIVSGIFWKRIKIKQPLESCATISYVLGVSKSQYSFEDTRTDSPYNTYTNRGLPPGPIDNPSISSIKAAIYPQDSDYVYFLSDQDTKETVFARTLDEHVRNKQLHNLGQ